MGRITAGSAAGVDVLVGSNRHECRFFFVPTGVVDRADEPLLAAVAAGYRLPPSAVERYRAASPGAPSVLALLSSAVDFVAPRALGALPAPFPALGLGLGIDYALLMISRFREHLAEGGQEGVVLVGRADRDTQATVEARPGRAVAHQHRPVDQVLPHLVAAAVAGPEEHEVGARGPHVDRQVCQGGGEPAPLLGPLGHPGVHLLAQGERHRAGHPLDGSRVGGAAPLC